LALSWVSAPLAVVLYGLMALYYAFDQASVPAVAEPDDQPPARRSAECRKKLARRYLARGGMSPMVAVPRTMQAIRLHAPGVDGLRRETIDTPSLQLGEALVEVHAAAITRGELEWPLDRLPAVPSYELSGVVAAVADDIDAVSVGDEVYALTPFDRDGVAAEYAAVPAATLAPNPSTLSHVESVAVPLPALSAWQGLFAHGGLEYGERVLVHGAVGGVGQFATQLARWRGAYVVATASRSTRRSRCRRRPWPSSAAPPRASTARSSSGLPARARPVRQEAADDAPRSRRRIRTGLSCSRRQRRAPGAYFSDRWVGLGGARLMR
jgi:hypothetical protein